MRFLVEAGKPKGASGGLSKMHADEALIVYRYLQKRGNKHATIYDAKTGETVSEEFLVKIVGKDKG